MVVSGLVLGPLVQSHLTSHRDEEQGRAHASRAAVEPLLWVLQSSYDHADALVETATRLVLYQTTVNKSNANATTRHIVSLGTTENISSLKSVIAPGLCVRPTHRKEEDAAQQGSSQGSLHHLLQAGVPLPVAAEQGSDIEGHLRDGPKGGVHQCAHSKVTLG